MLPPRFRLREAADFSAAVRHGRRAGNRMLVVHHAPAPDEGARIGFVVSRAVGSAVVRNRVRRRLRHLVAERMDGAPDNSTDGVSGGLWVVRAQPAAAHASFGELRGALDRCLSRIHREERA